MVMVFLVVGDWSGYRYVFSEVICMLLVDVAGVMGLNGLGTLACGRIGFAGGGL